MSYVMTVTDRSFEAEVANHEGLALVDFWAAWCGPCRFVGPIVDQLAAQFRGRVKVAKLDVDANPTTTHRFSVQAIPTLLVYRGGEVVDRVVGVVPKAALVNRLEAHLSRGPRAAA